MASHPSYSPYSSAGLGQTSKGTPSTHMSRYSHDDSLVSCMSFGQPSSIALLKTDYNDPFVTISQDKEQKLSATASTFRPVGSNMKSLNNEDITEPLHPASAEYLQRIVEIEEAKSPSKPETQFGTFTTLNGASRSIKVSKVYVHSSRIVGLAVKSSLDKLYKDYTLKGEIQIASVEDVVYLHLDHLGDATEVFLAIKKDNLDLNVAYVPSVEFASVVSPAPTSEVKYSSYEGQVYLQIRYPNSPIASRAHFEKSMREMLTLEGPFVAWKRLNTADAELLRIVGEFEKASDAQLCVDRCAHNSHYGPLASLKGTVTHYNPNFATNHKKTPKSTPKRGSSYGAIHDNLQRLGLDSAQPGSVTRLNFGGVSQPSPLMPIYSPQSIGQGGHPIVNGLYAGQFGPGMVSPVSSGSPYTPAGIHRGFEHQLAKLADMSPLNSSVPYHNFYGSGNRGYFKPSPNRKGVLSPIRNGYDRHGYNGPNPHNHVNPHKVRAGSDVRTTVMLRNIPNKINQAELKEILDESSFGLYDFAYLRIDFSNDCNVGYAFINFADPLDIIPFYEARAGRKWLRFKSDKIAEISYATIQGRDCLIQKFRNSSVMLEEPHYRPKLFYTAHDPLGRVGTEEEFPKSDNPSKLKRSCENAEHVGLFAPSAGQQLRDEQRRRRSQFDRGTSLAERDEFEYHEGRLRAALSQSPSPLESKHNHKRF